VNKVIDSLAMKIPVITGESKTLKDFFNLNDDIFVCQRTPESLAAKILEVSNLSIDNIKKNVHNSYVVFLEHFTTDVFKEKINDILSE
jgi:hypothetical protein